ncbi:hypothetical protein [Maricaulis sp.]|uniref:hypothetical protein n=1 Tax=Maricaulis sp. TaxID=1486257 RepID=UPI003A918B13
MSTRKFLIPVMHLALCALLAALTGFIGYGILVGALETAQAEHLQAYIQVRSEREARIFEDARVLNQSAELAFQRRLASLQGQPVEAEFDRLFPLYGDGTRRSAPDLFDGTPLPGGDVVFGVGAFLANGAEMTETDKRRYLAAFHTIRSVGEAYLGRFTSLYFFTPDRRMVIFAPGREDRLSFYRADAPADFELRGDEDAALFDLRLNPDSEMQCTRLSRFVYSDGGDRAASACRQPVREGETLLGGFGTSISMNETLASALDTPPARGVNLLFDRNGDVISRGAVAQSAQPHPALQPDAIMALLRADPRPFGVFVVPGGANMIAFSRIRGPSWYFVSVVDLSATRATARFWAWCLAAMVLFAALGFHVLRAVLVRAQPAPGNRSADAAGTN